MAWVVANGKWEEVGGTWRGKSSELEADGLDRYWFLCGKGIDQLET